MRYAGLDPGMDALENILPSACIAYLQIPGALGVLFVRHVPRPADDFPAPLAFILIEKRNDGLAQFSFQRLIDNNEVLIVNDIGERFFVKVLQVAYILMLINKEPNVISSMK